MCHDSLHDWPVIQLADGIGLVAMLKDKNMTQSSLKNVFEVYHDCLITEQILMLSFVLIANVSLLVQYMQSLLA